MSTEDIVTEVANITRGLTNRVEICVLNNLGVYNFSINRPDPPRVVERPRLPTLVVGEGGLVQEGLTHQARLPGGPNQNFGPNHYELIENNRYEQVKELLGYMGLKTADYDLFKVINKDTEVGVVYMDCGSNQAIDIDGIVYSPDTGSGGSSYSEPYEQIVSGGRWEPLYQTARSMGESGNGTLSWEFDLDANTFHKIILRFADFWENTRTADIYINDWKRREDFNIVERAGGSFKRTDLSFRVPVNQNKIELSITGRGHLNAIDIYRLDKGDVEFVEASREDEIANKDIYLFVNKNISLSSDRLKARFLEIQNAILRSRNLFFF